GRRLQEAQRQVQGSHRRLVQSASRDRRRQERADQDFDDEGMNAVDCELSRRAVEVKTQQSNEGGALPLPACGERAGVRGTLQAVDVWTVPLTRSLRSRPLPPSAARELSSRH